MSLDVCLILDPDVPATPRTRTAIFVRENGRTREITREEWDARFPGCEPVSVPWESESKNVFESNITHNLNAMADAAGIYKHLWRPEELGITKARELIKPLRAGLARLRAKPQDFARYNAKNGWGTYEQFVPWVEEYLNACCNFPDASVSVSR